jgi:pimeloyl-ACP methyl ester carboxylesterase
MNSYRHKNLLFLLYALLFLSSMQMPVCADELSSPFDNGRFVQVDTVRLHVREWSASPSSSDVCPVLLIHGFGGSTFSFRELAPKLAASGHRVLAIDLPGYGYSERKPFNETAASALWVLLEREQANSAWCLLGHSMGAKLVGQMAALKPKQVRALAYVDGSPFLSSERRKKWFSNSGFMRKTMVKWVETFYLNEKKFTNVLTTAYGRKPTKAEVEGYLTPLLIPGTADAVFGGYAKKWSEDTQPQQVQSIPSLIIWGAQDKWIKPEVGKALAKKVPKAAFLVVDAAGHCPIETHFDAVLPAIKKVFSLPAIKEASQ